MCLQKTRSARSSRFADLVGRCALRNRAGGETITRAGSRKHIQFASRALATAAIGLLAMTGAQAQRCKGNPHTGACAWDSPVICSPVESGGGETGKCTTSGRTTGEIECHCVGSGETLPPPPLRPWDVVESDANDKNHELDDNGFLRNPVWFWQKQNLPPQNACNGFCPCDQGPDAWSNGESSSSCTNQVLHDNRTCPSLDPFPFQGHMNWFPVEYEGSLKWDDKSTVFDWDWSWNIQSKNNDSALVTKGWEDSGVHLEFDVRETGADWHLINPGIWFEGFYGFVMSTSDKTTIRNWFGTKFAIVIGMLGLDLEHDAHAELHPVYAMFIRLPEQTATGETSPTGATGPTSPTSGPVIGEDVRWAFFVRNWGNEGYCGGNNEPLPNTRIQVRLPDQMLLARNVWVYAHDLSASSVDECASQSQATIEPSAVGTLITFDLPPASKKCGIVGDLMMRGSPIVVGGGGGTHEAPEEHEGDPVLKAKVARLDPSARRQLDEQLEIVMSEPTSGPTVRRMEVMVRNPIAHIERPPAAFERSRVAPILPNYGKGLEAVPNPIWQAQQEKKRRFIDAFLKAHGID
jgi:hypothetical protein